jgi:hypothetical protein
MPHSRVSLAASVLIESASDPVRPRPTPCGLLADLKRLVSPTGPVRPDLTEILLS